MIRLVINADGTAEKKEVGKGFRTWNAAIDASMGQIVDGKLDGKKIELWCDEEALCRNDPQQNFLASLMANQPIFGNVIVFEKGDIK